MKTYKMLMNEKRFVTHWLKQYAVLITNTLTTDVS